MTQEQVATGAAAEDQTEKSTTPWKKYCAIGCGVMLLAGIAFAGCLGAGFYGIVQVIKSSEPYKIAKRVAQENPAIEKEIGKVTGFGFMPSGNVNVQNDSGNADLSIGVEGEKGSGTLSLEAKKTAGKWKVTSAFFISDDGDRIPLEVDSP